MTAAEREAAHAMGLSDADLEHSFGPDETEEQEQGEAFPVWPENEAALRWFIKLEKQWRLLLGMGGLVYQGLRYDIALLLLREAGLKRKARNAVMDDLRLMEDAALPLLNASDD